MLIMAYAPNASHTVQRNAAEEREFGRMVVNNVKYSGDYKDT